MPPERQLSGLDVVEIYRCDFINGHPLASETSILRILIFPWNRKVWPMFLPVGGSQVSTIWELSRAEPRGRATVNVSASQLSAPRCALQHTWIILVLHPFVIAPYGRIHTLPNRNPTQFGRATYNWRFRSWRVLVVHVVRRKNYW